MASSALYPRFRATDPSTGLALVGGKLFTYAAGTTTPQATYSDAALTVANANPIILDANGEATLYVGPLSYKFVLQKSDGSAVWTFDNYAPNLATNQNATPEWLPYSGAFTFVNATQFSITGIDATATFSVGRRVKTTNTAGTVYGTITQSVFTGGNTAVTVKCDGATALDAGLSAINYGINSYVNPSYLDPLSIVVAHLTANVLGWAARTQVTTFTEDLDLLNEFAAGAFTAKYPGVYDVTVSTQSKDTAAGIGQAVYININGSDYAGDAISTQVAGVVTGMTAHATLNLAAGDVIKTFFAGSANTTLMATGGIGALATKFEISRIR